MRESLLALWQHRDLVWSFAVRDMKARYKQTALGVAWAMLQPLSMAIVFTLVFSLFARLPSDGIPYPVFVYSALIFWTFFANSISGGTVSMVANSPLIRKIYFPRETLIVSVLLATGLDLLLASTIFGGMLIWYRITLTAAALWVVPLVILQVVLAFAVASTLAALHVNFRDIGHGLPLLLQLWMFASPVAYPISAIPNWLVPYYLLNPMAGIIDGYRRALLRGLPPDWGAIGISALITVVVLAAALPIFRRAERTFADVI